MRKQIPGYENYEVSNTGIVRRYGKELKQFYSGVQCQARVSLYKGGRYTRRHYLVSRLVYCTFNNIDVEFNGKNLICHRDDNPKNNILENLFLGTQSDNMKDCFNKLRGVIPALKGSLNPKSKLNEKQVYDIKRLIKKGVKQNIIAGIYNISKSTINSICKGKSWNHVSR